MTLITQPLSEAYGTLSYREVGQGAPIVLIHGVGMQSAAWAPQVETLSQQYRVIAVDMPGHGGSSPLPPDTPLPAFVDWLQAVMQALQLRHVYLAGHSMGALIAAGYAVTYPKELKGVALLNGVFKRSNDARAAVVARAQQIRSGGFDLETPLARWFGDTAIEQSARDNVAQWLSAVDLEGYATAYNAFAKGDDTYADRFSEIACPFLALTGDGDQNSTPEMSQAMADAVPNGVAKVIKGHRHMVNLTAPDEVSSALLNWVQSTRKEPQS
ncbi:alpha/beta fold hydrolase [Sulfitobacter donghicola]|uniref:Alpha/beta hydrolase n=1 Tax=Sulfitobacter donghicola DSW-25 = KCTC 12864 = JCM 14565 TaxID=1300350 RepID=A0A073IID4_9RHOB|nr:alpha/beta hydrolase [Sulfitobacter donghicola]KEJ90078.1 alpha/beta hydrolase [Sulfitobacter donghicola DSW-25 = KCTC 12864 = JCM 14565]KIN66776.1 Hydrolase [Sulfitobacter donghicola DSW-25 = KCTC 12864 = JCM 14565]